MDLSENIFEDILNFWDKHADKRSAKFPLTKNFYLYLLTASTYLILQFVSVNFFFLKKKQNNNKMKIKT